MEAEKKLNQAKTESDVASVTKEFMESQKGVIEAKKEPSKFTDFTGSIIKKIFNILGF